MGSVNRPQRPVGTENIGKPCAGEPHARFDEGARAKSVMSRLLRHRQTKGMGTVRPGLTRDYPALYPIILLFFYFLRSIEV